MPFATVPPWLRDNAVHATGAAVRIAVIVVLAVLARVLLHRLVDQLVRRMGADLPERLRTTRLPGRRLTRAVSGEPVPDASAVEAAAEERRQRAETIGAVLRSVATVVVGLIAVIMVLGELGVAIGPLLASAGIAGFAIGFGAQNVVKDFLAGTFMILEDQYGVGDVVDVGVATGSVEDVGLRITRLRDGDGVVWYVRNGEILRVGNKSQGWSSVLVDVGVAPSEDVERVAQLVQDTAEAMAAEPEWSEVIVEVPRVLGVESVTGEAITFRVLIKTRPNRQQDAARELRERLKVSFDRHGVQLPHPNRPYGASTTPPR